MTGRSESLPIITPTRYLFGICFAFIFILVFASAFVLLIIIYILTTPLDAG